MRGIGQLHSGVARNRRSVESKSWRDNHVSLGRPKQPRQTALTMARCLFWYRKSLRLHDNPALLHATKGAEWMLPVFVLDPAFLTSASESKE